MSLREEIESRRRAIKTDSYSMSLGELMNLYQSQELDLHPDFQRSSAGQTRRRPNSSNPFFWAYLCRLSSCHSAATVFGM